MTLKPWREIAIPHDDVLKGTFQQAEFAADLSRVHGGTATAEYQDPVLFFQRTFITEGMRLLLDSVVRRLAGKGGDPVIQLQTAFGGGKTHTMLAVYHLAKGEAAAEDLLGVAPILKDAGVKVPPRANIVVLDGINLSPSQPQKHGKTKVGTLWGELAWQLGGDAAYQRVADADASGTSPGKDVLAKLLADHAPCVILIDELVAYIRQFEEGRHYCGGSYDANLSFIQALTEALKAVPTAVLLASLPESDKEAGSQRGVAALASLSHYFARVQALWKPVESREAFEIVRRRLFTGIGNRKAAEAVCRAYADFYIENGSEFPEETQESQYYQRLLEAYPIHPEVFERLYRDWSSLDNFQRTRGVLKLMAKVIHRLWQDDNKDLMIQPGNLPLYDGDVRNELIYYLPQGWDPVLEGDIDGERAVTAEVDRDTRFGAYQAARRVGRTIFLGSAPATQAVSGQLVRGLELAKVLMGSLQPGQTVGVFRDALNRLNDKCHYLNRANDRYWYDIRPNLRREMEERKRRFEDKADVLPAIQQRLQRLLAQGEFGGIHVFTPSGDVPDDWALRLVVLPPDACYSRTEPARATDEAGKILKQRGDQPRQKQNRLIFLAADGDSVSRLRDQTRTMLAWQSIVNDIGELKLNLDQHQSRSANRNLEESREAFGRMAREAYRWVLVPMQEARTGKVSDLQWEAMQASASAPNLTAEIVRVLRENECLISEWAPIHLSNMLKAWFWKEGASEANALDVWQKTCSYLYLPRLASDEVFKRALAAGAPSQDFFGFAYGKEDGHYQGFIFGRPTTPILDSSGALLLIEPKAAAEYAARKQPEAPQPEPPGPGEDPRHSEPPALPGQAPRSVKRRFYGTVQLNPITTKLDFNQIVDEVLLNFTAKADSQVTVTVEIHASSSSGFDDNTQRAVRENCRMLRFTSAEFEDE